MIKVLVPQERGGERSAEIFSHWLLKEHLPKLREQPFDQAG